MRSAAPHGAADLEASRPAGADGAVSGGTVPGLPAPGDSAGAGAGADDKRTADGKKADDEGADDDGTGPGSAGDRAEPAAAADGAEADSPGADNLEEGSTGSEGTGAEEPVSLFTTSTQDTALPEGGERAAPGDAPAPARQWPLLSVLGATAVGLAVVGLHPFADAFRVGTILIGIALMGGAVLRRLVSSVGMLAVRSRFTDMVTYGLLGILIVLLALMTQPRPWLEVPFLEDVVHSTVP
jgi:hypothetical protein